MVKYHHTDTAPAPFSNYSQAVEVASDSRIISVSGQVGVDLDGNLASTEAGQHEQTWANIFAILTANGMGPQNIIDVTAYLTSQTGVPIYREARDKMLGDAKPASTLLIVSGLADPAWKVEITVMAAS